jgi:hypothetical protein
MAKLASTPIPEGQKFLPGERVRIAQDLGFGRTYHDGKGCMATVKHTHAHAYGGRDVKSYCLDIDGIGEVSWYDESNLTAENA